MSNVLPVRARDFEFIYGRLEILWYLVLTESLSDDQSLRLAGVNAIRRLLSVAEDPPVTEVLEANVVPKFIEIMNDYSFPKIQFEACWAITNIGSSEHTPVLAEHGAIPVLVRLLKDSADTNVRDQSIWCLGNIAGDGPSLRNQLLETPSAVEHLMLNIKHPGSKDLLRNATWTLSNLCRGKPAPNMHFAQQFIPALAHLVTLEDTEVLTDALWALSYLTNSENEIIELVVNSNIAGKVIGLLGHSCYEIVIPALRTAGNIVAGTDTQADAAVNAGIIPKLVQLMKHDRKNAIREAVWTASNIAAGTKDQISALVSFPGALDMVIHHLAHSPWEIKKEAAWTVANIVNSGSGHDVDVLVAANALEPLIALVHSSDVRITLVVLEAFESILQQGRKNMEAGRSSDFTDVFEEAGGLDALETLQDHESEQVYQKVVDIMSEYFEAEEAEDQNFTPGVEQTNSGDKVFSFGAKQTATPTQPNNTVFGQSVGSPVSNTGFNFAAFT